MTGLEVGYDIPAQPGMTLAEVATPCLIVDLDALESNIAAMARIARDAGLALRPHGKMHKCAEIAHLQIGAGAVGLCCQKVSEAEAFVRAGVTDVLVSNEVRGPAKVDRLARLAGTARIGVCVDDLSAVPELAAAVARHGTSLDVLVELDIGAGRCGVTTPEAALALARAVDSAEGLTFAGLQAYQGNLQHLPSYAERTTAAEAAHALLRRTLEALDTAGLPARTVTGGGTGSFPAEIASTLYTELQCGSYALMDADYGRIEGATGGRLDGVFTNALFVLTEVMSARPGHAVGDAGLKSQTGESGLPVVFGAKVTVTGLSDEHVTLAGDLAVGDRLRLIPGHCDPTINLHDWLVAVRGEAVEALWPVTARGKSF